MATLRDTVVHDKLAVIDGILLTDYRYSAIKGSYGLLEFGQSGVDTKIYGKDLIFSSTNFEVETTGYQKFTAGTNYTITAGGYYIANITGDFATSVGGATSFVSTGNISVSGKAAISATSTSTLTLTAGTTAMLSGYIVNLTSGTTMNLTSSGKMSLYSGDFYVSGSNIDMDSKGYVDISSVDSYVQLTASTYVNIDGLLVVKSTNYGTAAPTTTSPGSYTGELYFRIVS